MTTIIVSIIQGFIFYAFGKHIGEDSSVPLSKGIRWIVVGSLVLAVVCWARVGEPMIDENGYVVDDSSYVWFESLSKEGKSLARLKVFTRIFLCGIIPGLFGFVRERNKVTSDKISKQS